VTNVEYDVSTSRSCPRTCSSSVVVERLAHLHLDALEQLVGRVRRGAGERAASTRRLHEGRRHATQHRHRAQYDVTEINASKLA